MEFKIELQQYKINNDEKAVNFAKKKQINYDFTGEKLQLFITYYS